MTNIVIDPQSFESYMRVERAADQTNRVLQAELIELRRMLADQAQVIAGLWQVRQQNDDLRAKLDSAQATIAALAQSTEAITALAATIDELRRQLSSQGGHRDG
jgi:Mg2+ and Co2+ transporter CorA